MGAGKSFPGIDSMHTYPMKGDSHHEPDSEKLVATEEDRSRGPARFLRDPRHNLHLRAGAGKNHYFAVRRGESLHERFGRLGIRLEGGHLRRSGDRRSRTHHPQPLRRCQPRRSRHRHRHSR